MIYKLLKTESKEIIAKTEKLWNKKVYCETIKKLNLLKSSL